jgi:hypothetical protein
LQANSKYIIQNINNKKSNTSMKKLLALLVVAGMVFISCGTKTEEVADDATVDQTEAVVEETTTTDETTPVEAVTEEAAPAETAPVE